MILIIEFMKMYFNVCDNDSKNKVFQIIDKLERSKSISFGEADSIKIYLGHMSNLYTQQKESSIKIGLEHLAPYYNDKILQLKTLIDSL